MKTFSWRPYIVLFIGLLAVSSASILIRYASTEGASSLVIAMWRVMIASLILTPIVLSRYRADLAGLTRGELGLGLISGALLGIHFASWITSLEYTSVLTSTTLVTTNPLIVAAATPFVLREKLSRGMVYAILLAIVGAAIISVAGDAGTASNQKAPLLGAFLAIVGSFTVAGYYLIGRRLRAKVPVLPYIWLTYGSAAVVLIIMVMLNRLPVTGLKEQAYFWMTMTALVPQLIGHSSFNYALGYLSAAHVSLTGPGEPIGAAILAILLLRELPQPLQIVGGAVVLIALFLASREEFRAERNKRQKQTQPAQVIPIPREAPDIPN